MLGHRPFRRWLLSAIVTAGAAFAIGLSTVSADNVFVSAITPAAGPPAGNDQITITGAGFTPGSGVFLGGTRALDAVTLSDTTIVANTPAAGGPGTVTVTVLTDNGSAVLPDGYRYIGALSFTDDPLTATVTPVKAQHIDELRHAIDTVRFVGGQTAGGWTDDPLVAGTTVIGSTHMLELRGHLEAALSAMHFPGTSYSDPSLPPATVPVKAVHVQQLRTRVRSVGPYCSYALSTQSFAIDATGGDISVSVTTGGSCVWAVTPDTGWVTTGDGGLHTGSGSFGLTVQSNVDAARSTMVWVGSQRFTVLQGAP